MTLLEVLQRTTDFFKNRGIENPRLNAEHLLAHVLGRQTSRETQVSDLVLPRCEVRRV